MKRKTNFIFKLIIYIVPLLFFAGGGLCQHQDNTVRIAWDYSSIKKLAERGGYPRLLRLQDESLLAIYETYTGYIHLKKSVDNGKSWSAPREVFAQLTYAALDGESTIVNMSNPEIIQLKNGDIILACNYRPKKQEIAPYTIVIRRSLDTGYTWQPPQTLYVAAPRFKDGCWEPSFLQLPDGELQVYFANENPYRNSDEQEISMVSSKDNGLTWTPEAKTVSFRQGKRDGMPVPVLLKDEIVAVVEDNKLDQFKPYTVRTKVADNWSHPVLANSDNRNYALKKKVEDSVYMGAPYLLKLPNGQTLLSYQTNENRSKNWELSTLEVVIGDENARNFEHSSRPFDLGINQQAKWNSVALWDSNTVVALASTDFNSKIIAPQIIKGYFIPNILKVKNKIEELPVFVGSRSQSSVRAGVAHNNKDIIIECLVTEKIPFDKNSGVNIFFYTEKEKYKLWCAANGSHRLFLEKKKQWQPVKNSGEVKITSHKDGYKINCTMPFKKGGINLALGLALSSSDEEGNGYTEYLAQMNEHDVGSWIGLRF